LISPSNIINAVYQLISFNSRTCDAAYLTIF
jgi:hypothetical protein